MKPIRVFYNPDGTMIIMRPILKALKPGQSLSDFLDAEAVKSGLEALPHDDLDMKDLPDMGKRGKWRGAPGEGVWIDEAVVTRAEKIKAKGDELDAELAKPSPDAVKVIKLNRELENMKNGK